MSMSEGQILVTFEAVQQASQDCATTNQNIQQQLTDLHTYLGPMIEVWTGAAAENYQALQHQWDQAATDLSDLLQEISRALQSAGDNYQQTESANANIWS